MRFIRLKVLRQYDYHWRRQNDQIHGLHFEHRDRNPRGAHLKRLLRRILTHVTDYSHRIRGWDSRDQLLENGRGVGLVLSSFKRGRNEPAYLMNPFGKLAYIRDSEVLTSALQIATGDVTPRGVRIPLPRRELPSKEMYANSIEHSLNGWPVNVVEIFPALALRNRAFGAGNRVDDSNTHTVKEDKLNLKGKRVT